MAQHDYVISNQGFASYRSDHNSSLSAIVSNNSGATEPTTTYAYQWWYDETTDTLKMRNSDNDAWITMFTFNQTTDTYSLATDVELTITENLDLTGSATISGDLTVDTDTLFVDSSSNRVGVGQTSPTAILHIGNDSAGDENTILRIEGGSTSGFSRVHFADSSDTNIGRIQYAHASDFMALYTNDSEALRIDSSGHAIIPNGVTLGTATGVYNASNTLDDYEEGTWTPVLSDATSGGNNPSSIDASGAYTKIGRMVRVSFALSNIDTTGMTSGNSLTVQGLPFTAGSSTPLQISDSAVKCDKINFTNYVIASSNLNQSYFGFRDIRDNTTDAALLVSAVTSTGSDIVGGITYFTD